MGEKAARVLGHDPRAERIGSVFPGDGSELGGWGQRGENMEPDRGALCPRDLWGEQWGGATSQRNKSGGSDGPCAPGSVSVKAVFINRW